MNNKLTHKDYYATPYSVQEMKCFMERSQGINGLVTFEGQSVRELKKACKDAIEDYILTCKELNKTPEKTYKGNFRGIHK